MVMSSEYTRATAKKTVPNIATMKTNGTLLLRDFTKPKTKKTFYKEDDSSTI